MVDILLFYSLNQDLNISDVRFAQTHVIPIEGKTWYLNNKTFTLTIVGDRDSLLLVKFDGNSSSAYTVMVWNSDVIVGSRLLNDPNQLPPTESNGEKYSNQHHNIMIPKEWVKPGMKLQFYENCGNSIKISKMIFPNVGQDYTLKMWTLPFYLFGANDTNTKPYNQTKNIDDSISAGLSQVYSCSNILSLNHPIQRVDWPYLVLGPRNGFPGMLITNSDQKKDGYAIMEAVLNILTGIRVAFGESTSSIQIYAPLLHLGANGKYADPYGGLGGSSRGTGDYRYSDTFVHEQGHAMGLPHAGEAYNAGNYPYVNGSLLGSEWGFDINHYEFLSITISNTSKNYKGCEKKNVKDIQNRCVKQSVMQSGAGDRSSNYLFSMFSDFEMSIIQNYFKNSIFYDQQSRKYKKWNESIGSYYEYKPITKDNGFYRLDDGVPIERDIDIYTIVFTYSMVGPDELTQIYPLLKSKGNLMRQFDPTNKTEMKLITPNIGSIPWYCYSSGCDYTVRVTYDDDSIKHILLQQGKRQYWKPMGEFKLNFNDPTSLDSFLLGVINVKGNKTIKKVELLETLMAWNGIDKNSKVLTFKLF
ncbi:hypothetical protein RB653_003800 [Dictyostelium firmibasis]|uniref:Peptidase M66 domain-containing protein n=1 Tax=Dictyostelium firmibasis TaxID=79012 RepID=A0AAN7YZF7_9MYCE